MPTRRQERVAKRVQQELVEAIRNLKHVKLGFTTITKCEVSPDLRHARVFVSVLGDDEVQEKSLGALKNHASKLRMAIARPLGTKVVPDLHFEMDESIANADRMSRLIRDARSTDANPAPLTPEEEAELLARAPARAGRHSGFPEDGVDVFETARQEVEEELFGDEEDDPDWKPINLDALPDDED